MSSHRTWMRPLNLTVVAAAAAWALWRMGAALPLPRGVARHEVDQWLREQGAPAATFAIARVGALVFAVYATGLGMLAMLAALTRRAAITRVTLRLALPAVRPLLTPIAAVTITVATALPAAAQTSGAPRPPAPIMQVVAPPSSAPPVMTLVPAAAPPTAPGPATHTVRAGDTFWSIAAETLRASGRSVGDAEIIPYWRSMIEANRDRLRARDEPDLIYPGQVFVLPPIS